MKRTMCILAALTCISAFTGCGSNSDSSSSPKKQKPTSAVTSESTFEETTEQTTETQGTAQMTIKSGEYGNYGKRVVLAAKTDMPDTRYVYKLPAGDYKVENDSTTTIATIAIVKDALIPHEDDPTIDTFDVVGKPYSLSSADNDMNGLAKDEYTLTLAEDEQFLIYNGSAIIFTALSGQTLEEYTPLGETTDNSPETVQSQIKAYFDILYDTMQTENPVLNIQYLEDKNTYAVSFLITGAKSAYVDAQNGNTDTWNTLEDMLLTNCTQAAYLVNKDYDIDAHMICTLLDDTNPDNILIGAMDGYINYNAV